MQRLLQRSWVRTAIAPLAMAPLVFALALPAQTASGASGTVVLNPADYRHYVDTFHQQEREATGKLYEGEDGEEMYAILTSTAKYREIKNEE